jgi:hypothetical protein
MRQIADLQIEIWEKPVTRRVHLHGGGFRRARLVHGMARLRLSRLSEKISLALARRCFGLRLHLDRRKRAKDVAG